MHRSMNRAPRALAGFVTGILLAACAGPQSPPRFALKVPELFQQKMEREKFRQGEALGNEATMQMFPDFRAERPQTRWRIKWAAGDPEGWLLIVERGAVPKVERALTAKDGYEADLARGLTSSARIYPRFRHKKFAWGEAVSFLTQYQADRITSAPNNDMLTYEVYGITSDRAFTVQAGFKISHPGLRAARYAREYPGGDFPPNSPMRRDPDYRLVENCPDAQFSPSIREIDEMLNRLEIRR